MHSLIVAFLMLTPPAGAAPPPAPNPAGAFFDALVKQAGEAQEHNRLNEALDLYRRAVALRPAWDEGWWSIGMIAYDQDKFSECAPAFLRFRSLKPDLAPGWIMSGLCEYRLRQYDAAYRSLLEAERLGFQGSPELARVGRLHLALLLTKNSNFERALLTCGILFRSGETTPEAIAAAGVAGLGRPLLLSEVPEADRPLVMALGNALAAAFAKPSGEAVERFQSALQAYPNVADIHYRFGAYLMKSEPARGLAEVKRAFELNPAHIPALVTLSIECMNSGDYQNATEYGEKAVRAAPNNYASHLMLGRAFLLEIKSRDLVAPPGKAAQSGKAQPQPAKLRDAVRELETAVKLEPDSQDAHFSLSAAYALAGRAADAARERAEYERLRNLASARTGL